MEESGGNIGSPIADLPPSITNLNNLVKLSLSGYRKLQHRSISCFIWSWIAKTSAPKVQNNQLITSFSEFRSLPELELIECNLSDHCILEAIGNLQSLEGLCLENSVCHHLTSSISCLRNLKARTVHGCPMESVPELPPSVIHVNFPVCPTLKEISCSKLNHDTHIMLRLQESVCQQQRHCFKGSLSMHTNCITRRWSSVVKQ